MKLELDFEVIQWKEDNSNIDDVLTLLRKYEEDFTYFEEVPLLIEIERSFYSVVDMHPTDWLFLNEEDSLFMVMGNDEYQRRFSN